MKNFALQLYSVKNALEKDFEGTLKAVAEMGYDGVEFYGGYYGNFSAVDLKEKLEFYGLDAVAVHIDLKEAEENLDYHIDFIKKLDCNMIICSYSKPKTVDEAENIGERLLKISEKCIISGIEFAYHNHAHEFEKPDDENTLFDILMSVSDPLVLAELDLGWIAKAGISPEEYIRKYAGRVPLVHLKQFSADEASKITTLESGIVDIESCIKTAKLMGTSGFIVEQDEATTDELTDAKKNIEYLKKLKV